MDKIKFLKFSNGFRWLSFGLLLALGACTGTASTPVPPGQKSDAGYGTVCKAGIYSCDLPYPVPLGSSCSCSGLGAASYGNVQAK